jgi:hypothetical protein
MAYHTTNSQSGNHNQKPWLTENFTERFREAFGRDMTAEEREFFGFDTSPDTPEEYAEAAD